MKSWCVSELTRHYKVVMTKSLDDFLMSTNVTDESIKEVINIMKPKQIFISILAVLFVFPLMGTFAQQAARSGSIEVITTFDYPGVGNNTLPQKINERGDVVGVLIDSSGVTRGIFRVDDGNV